MGRTRGTGARPRLRWAGGKLAASTGLALCVMLGGCASLVSSVTERLAEDLSSSILDNDDLDVVRDGAPAYLIMLDALLRSNPESP